MWAVHFGVYPDQNTIATVDGHTNPKIEGQLPAISNAHEGWVNGSWACWGTADQDTDGDNSLHVVFKTRNTSAFNIGNLYRWLQGMTDGRVLDYAIITDPGDDSDVQAIATFIGNPQVAVFEAGQMLGGADLAP